MKLSKGMDSDDLAGYLYTEIAGLLKAKEADCYVEAAFLLRDWLSPRLNYPERSLLLLHWEYDLAELLWMLQEGIGGVWCGGAAYLFAGLLNAIGIPAAVFMYGSEMLSHETTVFGVPGKDIHYYILDSYLNFHYVDSGTGAMLSLESLLRLVSGRQYSQIQRVDTKIARRLVLRDAAPEAYSWLYPGADVPSAPIQIHDDRRVYPGAVHSVEALLSGGDYKRLVDEARQGQPLNEFLLDMMLVRPKFSKVSIVPEAFADICLLRGVIAGLAREPAWASSQERADYRAWSRHNE